MTGTRCTRWTPPSCFSRVQASFPRTMNTTSVNPPMSDGRAPSGSTTQARAVARPWYMSWRSRANRFASSPPSAPRISTMTVLPALGSRGSNRTRSSPSSRAISSSRLEISSWSWSRSSPSADSRSSRAASRSSPAARSGLPTAKAASSSLWRRPTASSCPGSLITAGSASRDSTSPNSTSSASICSNIQLRVAVGRRSVGGPSASETLRRSSPSCRVPRQPWPGEPAGRQPAPQDLIRRAAA